MLGAYVPKSHYSVCDARYKLMHLRFRKLVGRPALCSLDRAAAETIQIFSFHTRMFGGI